MAFEATDAWAKMTTEACDPPPYRAVRSSRPAVPAVLLVGMVVRPVVMASAPDARAGICALLRAPATSRRPGR